MGEKLEVTKRKLSETQDEAMKQKLELGREQALMKQQAEFQNKKIEEMQKQMDEATRFYDDKISKQKLIIVPVFFSLSFFESNLLFSLV